MKRAMGKQTATERHRLTKIDWQIGSMMLIVVGNGYGTPSSNSDLGCLHSP